MIAFLSLSVDGGSKKVRQKLTAAIETGDISVVDKNGQSMTATSIAELLAEKPEKA